MILTGTTTAPQVNIDIENLDAQYTPQTLVSGQEFQNSGLTPEIQNNSNVRVRITVDPIVTGDIELTYVGFNGYSGSMAVELDPQQKAKIAFRAVAGDLDIGGSDDEWSIDFNPSVEYSDPIGGSWRAV